MKRWDDLTPTYRRRLERKGYTREDYLAGRSRAIARGHGATPEHPERALKSLQAAERYSDYLSRKGITIAGPPSDRRPPPFRDAVFKDRDNFITKLIGTYRKMIGKGEIDSLDVFNVRTYIQAMSDETFAAMKVASIDEIRHAAKHNPYKEPVLDSDVYLNGMWVNPFWYH